MATRYNYTGQLVTNGLVLNLDAAKVDSYPGTGTAWRDLSGNNNNGTLTNGPTFSGIGKQAAIVFDGVDDYIITSQSQSFNDFSVCAFFKDNSSTGYARIVDGRYIDGFWFGRDGSGQSNKYGGGCKQISGFNFITLTAGQWHFIAMTRSGTTLTVYGDGITNTNITTCGSGSTALHLLTVGATINDGDPVNPAQRDWFKGNIPSIQIYNRALSATEVSQNFNALRGRYGI
jgi:hypothetical protein